MAQDEGLDLETAMVGILALLAAEREERIANTEHMRTELLLANAGLPIREIARLLGKNYQAVQKAIWRDRGKSNSRQTTPEVQTDGPE